MKRKTSLTILFLLLYTLMPPAVPAQSGGGVIVLEGTPIQVRLAQRLSSRTNQTGQSFEAMLDQALMVQGQLVAAEGNRVTGQLVQVRESGNVKGRATMTLTLQELEINGTMQPIETTDIVVEAEGTKKQDATVIGGGAGLGAIIGAIIGGKKGAIIGAALGAGAGTTAVLVTDGQEVEFDPEQRFRFFLSADLRPGTFATASDTSLRLQEERIEGLSNSLRDKLSRLRSTADRELKTGTLDTTRTISDQHVEKRLELLLALDGLACSTQLFSQLSTSYPESRLKGAMNSIFGQVARIDQLFPQAAVSRQLTTEWEVARTDALQLQDAWGSLESGAQGGWFRWRGNIDGSNQILLRGGRVFIRNLSGASITGATFEMDQELPARALQVSVRKLDGRGEVRLVEQPSLSNNYTAVVQIDDNAWGRDYYEVELRW